MLKHCCGIPIVRLSTTSRVSYLHVYKCPPCLCQCVCLFIVHSSYPSSCLCCVLVRVQQIVHRDAFSNAGSIFVFTLDVLMKRLLPTHTACPVDAVRLISVPRCYQRFVSLYLLYTPLPFRRRGGGDGPWVRGISQSQPPPWDGPPAADARLPVACEAKDVGRARFFRLVGGRGGAWEPKKASSPAASGPAAPIG